MYFFARFWLVIIKGYMQFETATKSHFNNLNLLDTIDTIGVHVIENFEWSPIRCLIQYDRFLFTSGY